MKKIVLLSFFALFATCTFAQIFEVNNLFPLNQKHLVKKYYLSNEQFNILKSDTLQNQNWDFTGLSLISIAYTGRDTSYYFYNNPELYQYDTVQNANICLEVSDSEYVNNLESFFYQKNTDTIFFTTWQYVLNDSISIKYLIDTPYYHLVKQNKRDSFHFSIKYRRLSYSKYPIIDSMTDINQATGWASQYFLANGTLITPSQKTYQNTKLIVRKEYTKTILNSINYSINYKILYLWFDSAMVNQIFTVENYYSYTKIVSPGSENSSIGSFARETDTTNLLYTSTEEPPNWGENNVTLYPNPVSYTLTADFTLPASQTVYFIIRDNSGTVVYSNSGYFMQGGNTYAFDVSAYTNGIYTLEIFPENLEPYIIPFIKQ